MQTAKSLKRVEEGSGDLGENGHISKKVKTVEDQAADEKKYPKKKVVLLMAYSGKGYYGMQVAILFSSGLNTHRLSVTVVTLCLGLDICV